MCARTHKKTSILQTVVVIYVLHHFSCLKNFCFPSVCGGSVVEMHSRSPHLIAVYTQFWKTLCAPLKIYLPPRMVVCDVTNTHRILLRQRDNFLSCSSIFYSALNHKWFLLCSSSMQCVCVGGVGWLRVGCDWKKISLDSYIGVRSDKSSPPCSFITVLIHAFLKILSKDCESWAHPSHSSIL